jgi:RNA polymerase sigma factor (sigma-70 family)
MARKAKEFKLTKEQQQLAADNINLARREAWKLQRTTDIDYNTLEGAALEGLCKAAHRYDPSSGFKFSSLAVPTIRGELLHWIRDKTYAMRLTHKMREKWIKGRKLMYKGSTDIQVAKELEIELSEWQEIKSVCSGPPLEINEQAKPTKSLEPAEMDFQAEFVARAEFAWNSLEQKQRKVIQDYFSGKNNNLPVEAIQAFLLIDTKR